MDEKTFGTKLKEFGSKYGRRLIMAGLVVGAFALGVKSQSIFQEDDSIEINELPDGFAIVEATTEDPTV